MIYFHRKSERNALIFFHIIFLSARFSDAAAANDITSQIRECCVKGLQYAKLNENCEKYEYEVSTIPALWRGLCHSSFGFCCSHRLDEVNCNAGQLAAKTGSRCDENLNSSIYSKCCRACQVGLAVNASNLDCNDSLFSFFSGVQSYKECCNGSPHQTDANTPIQNYKKDHLEPTTDLEENYGTIVLKDDDDDICGKVPNLCEHICENTKEAYQCKCKPGYVLEENNVTCRLQLISDLLNENITDDGSASDYVDVLDNNNSQTLTTDSCPLGFEYSTTRGKCEDIDECANENNCEFNQYCHNTIGSYHCLKINKSVCKSGYRFNSESQKCEDYDECEDFPCKLGFRCRNFPGGYECKEDSSEAVIGLSRECSEGFQSNNGDCVDIDECKTKNPCESNQICVNDLGKYHCECKIGYSLDTTTNGCVDINECSINNHNCLSTQRCDNTVGSYVCTRLQSCGTGYTFNAETNNCDDDDECALKTDNCPPSYECYNTKGSFRCYRKISTTTTSTTTTTTTLRPTTQQTIIRNPLLNIIPRNRLEFNATKNNGRNFDSPYTASTCDLGFYRNSLGACVDINECVVGHPCGSHQKCINTNGSYRCINLLECSAGFRASPDGSSCKDVDECETGEHNCADNQICQNKIGGYICSCPAGHQLARTAGGVNRCIDINECGQSQNICPSNSLCRNTIGSYFCECKPGFQKNHQNDRFCEDVDECQTIPELCQQKCINFWGGYRCSCNTGYELGPDNRTCNDVDECEVHKSYKPCMGYCNNIPGSYECSCPRGYTLALDKTTCRDIDECSSGAFCTGRNDICTNIRGSYRCTTIHCPYGYINDPDQKNRCRQISNTCDGEDCYNKPSAYTYNFITLTSKSIIPPDGRTIFSLRGPHWYDDTDFDLKILKIQAAANIEKATENHFETFKEKHIVNLILKRSLEGPQDIELELSMTVFSNGMPRGKSVAKIFIIVSQYEF